MRSGRILKSRHDRKGSRKSSRRKPLRREPKKGGHLTEITQEKKNKKKAGERKKKTCKLAG